MAGSIAESNEMVFVPELGEPESVFVLRNTTGNKLFAGVMAFVGVVCLFLVLCVLVALGSPKIQGDPTKTNVAYGVIGVFGLVGIGLLWSAISKLRVPPKGFAVYPDMLVAFVGDQWQRIRWRDVRNFHPPTPLGRDGYLTLQDGTHVPVSNELPHVAELRTAIESSMERDGLRGIVETLVSRKSVAFGALSLHHDGLQSQGKTLPWNQLARLEFLPDGTMDVLTVPDPDGQPWATVEIDAITNRTMFFELVQNLAPTAVPKAYDQELAILAAHRNRPTAAPQEEPWSAAAMPEEEFATQEDDHTHGEGFRGDKLLYGGILIVASFYLNWQLGELESGNVESIRVWWGFALLYEFFGKQLTVTICGLGGMILCGWGASDLLNGDPGKP